MNKKASPFLERLLVINNLASQAYAIQNARAD
jgi:hypothetical protein